MPRGDVYLGDFRVEPVRGRTIRNSALQQQTDLIEKQKQEAAADALNAIKSALLKKLDAGPVMQGIENLPFGTVKNLAYLQSVETYLSAQLLAVRKEIEKVKEQEDGQG